MGKFENFNSQTFLKSDTNLGEPREESEKHRLQRDIRRGRRSGRGPLGVGNRELLPLPARVATPRTVLRGRLLLGAQNYQG